MIKTYPFFKRNSTANESGEPEGSLSGEAGGVISREVIGRPGELFRDDFGRIINWVEEGEKEKALDIIA